MKYKIVFLENKTQLNSKTYFSFWFCMDVGNKIDRLQQMIYFQWEIWKLDICKIES